jgi:hypothetical protein
VGEKEREGRVDKGKKRIKERGGRIGRIGSNEHGVEVRAIEVCGFRKKGKRDP